MNQHDLRGSEWLRPGKIFWLVWGLVIIAVIIFFTIRFTDYYHHRHAAVPAASVSTGDFVVYVTRGSDVVTEGVDFGTVWSVRSDGTQLTNLGANTNGQFMMMNALHDISRGLDENMFSWMGEAMSFDGRHQFIMHNTVPLFGLTTLYLREANGDQPVVSMPFHQLRWLPDNRRAVFSIHGQIGILDTQTGKYGWLTDGWNIVAVENAPGSIPASQ